MNLDRSRRPGGARRWGTIGAVIVGLAAPGLGRAATLQVGPGKMYPQVSAAVAAAAPGDVIEVAPGEYVNDFSAVNQSELTIRGVGDPRPHLKATILIPNKKGIFVVNPNAGLTIEHLELSGAMISEGDGNNGAGVRMQGLSLTVVDCFFHDNQNGILAGGTPNFTVTIEGSEFADNGQAGYEHNVYISGEAAKLVFRGNYSHHAKHGHTLKSRAFENHILYNRIMDEADGYSSYLIDLPQGGLSYVIGNLIEQGPMAENTGTIVNYKGEGATNPDLRLFFAHNTVVNDNDKSPAFVRVHAADEVHAYNNLFVGAGTPLVVDDPNATVVDMGNLQSDDPGLVDRAGYDYHLAEGSPAIDAAVPPPAELVPDAHYLHPAGTEARPQVGALDVGAYEFGEDMGTSTGTTGETESDSDAGSGTTGETSGGTAGTTGGGTDGTTTATTDGSSGGATAGTSDDGSASATATTGADTSASTDASAGASESATTQGPGDDEASGCACRSQGAPGGLGALLLGLPLLQPWIGRRRRGRRSR